MSRNRWDSVVVYQNSNFNVNPYAASSGLHSLYLKHNLTLRAQKKFGTIEQMAACVKLKPVREGAVRMHAALTLLLGKKPSGIVEFSEICRQAELAESTGTGYWRTLLERGAVLEHKDIYKNTHCIPVDPAFPEFAHAEFERLKEIYVAEKLKRCLKNLRRKANRNPFYAVQVGTTLCLNLDDIALKMRQCCNKIQSTAPCSAIMKSIKVTTTSLQREDAAASPAPPREDAAAASDSESSQPCVEEAHVPVVSLENDEKREAWEDAAAQIDPFADHTLEEFLALADAKSEVRAFKSIDTDTPAGNEEYMRLQNEYYAPPEPAVPQLEPELAPESAEPPAPTPPAPTPVAPTPAKFANIPAPRQQAPPPASADSRLAVDVAAQKLFENIPGCDAETEIASMRQAGDSDEAIVQVLTDALNVTLKAKGKPKYAIGTIRKMSAQRRAENGEQARAAQAEENRQNDALRVVCGDECPDSVLKRCKALFDSNAEVRDELFKTGELAAREKLGMFWGSMGTKERIEARRPYVVKEFLDWEAAGGC